MSWNEAKYFINPRIRVFSKFDLTNWMKLVKKRVLREIQLPCWPAEFRFRVNDVLIGEISTCKSAHLRIKHNFVVVKRCESTAVERHYLTMHRPWTWMCSVWHCLIGDISASSQGPQHSHFCQVTVTATLYMSVMLQTSCKLPMNFLTNDNSQTWGPIHLKAK